MPAARDRLIEAIDKLGALAQTAPAPQSSVELTCDSKGNVKPVVKAYAPTVEEAAARAEAEFDRLLAKYAAPGLHAAV